MIIVLMMVDDHSLQSVELGLSATEWPLCSEGGLAARNVPCRELQAPCITPSSK